MRENYLLLIYALKSYFPEITCLQKPGSRMVWTTILPIPRKSAPLEDPQTDKVDCMKPLKLRVLSWDFIQVMSYPFKATLENPLYTWVTQSTQIGVYVLYDW